MAQKGDSRRESIGRLFNYANNGITIAGVVLTTLSGLLIIIFMVAQLWGGLDNPYIGVFAYVFIFVRFRSELSYVTAIAVSVLTTTAIWALFGLTLRINFYQGVFFEF